MRYLRALVIVGVLFGASEARADRWKDLVDQAMSWSSQQNNGTANIARACQPELASCTTAVWYKSYNDGTDIMVRITTDLNEKTISRDICHFNAMGDIRTCINFDTGASQKDMKDTSNHWSRVQ